MKEKGSGATTPREHVVVVGVDPSEGSQTALLWAAGEAKRRSCALEILHAWVEVGSMDEALAVARRAASAVKTIYPALEVRVDTPQAAAAEALVEASGRAELLVVGPRGLGGFRELLLGSVSHQCLQHAHCPVAVIRTRTQSGGPRVADTIVVGVDGSAGSDLALRWALEEADRRSARVRAVYAWQYPPVGSYSVGPPEGYQTVATEIVEDAGRVAAEFAPEVKVETVSRFGAPVQVLLDESEGADMLVLGSRGRGGFRGLLLGSVGNEAGHYARCPVVVVRPGSLLGQEIEAEAPAVAALS